MKPFNIALHLPQDQFSSGDILIAEFELTATRENAAATIKSWETSVLWYTHGKGETDIGVHFFERKKTIPLNADRQVHRLSTVLPASPLSYDGKILSIRWCVRVRLFLGDEGPITEDYPFQLGSLCYFEPIENAPAADTEADDD